MTRSASAARRLGVWVARVAFFGVCAYFAWRIFDDRWNEIVAALEQMAWWVLVSAVLTVAGLLTTSWLWTQILAAYGHVLTWHQAGAVFLTGQVGKYIPGSVWSMGAQARLVASTGTPMSSVVGTGLIFLALHVASGMAIGGAALAARGSFAPTARLLAGLVAVAGVAVFHPWVIGRLSQFFSGLRSQATTTWRRSGSYAVAMLVVWVFYTAALLVLVPRPSWSVAALLLAAVPLSYAAGVLVVVAPAGLGAREAVLISLLSPTLGIVESTALALVGRLVHTTADFALALAGARNLRPSRGVGASHNTQ